MSLQTPESSNYGLPTRRPLLAAVHREDGPGVGHTLQFMAAAVIEREPGPEHQRWDRAGHEHLTGRRERHDARSDVDRDAVHIAVDHLHLAGVQTGADGEAEVLPPRLESRTRS